MVKQLQELVNHYPWIVLLLAGMLLLGIGIAAVVMIIWKNRIINKSQPFEVLDYQQPASESLQFRQPVPPVLEDGDLTRQLFEYTEMELKSYQMELHDLNLPGQVYRVNVSDRITIGRKNHCIVYIPNNTLSGEHCEIVLKDGKLYLRDLNSTNGTFLNGCPGRVTEEELVSGSVIEMGSVRLRVQIAVIKF